MRLSDLDREQLYERLNRHAAAGRLDVAELERRVEMIAAATTSEEAAAVMTDLPPLPTLPGEPPPARARRGRGHGDADKPAADWRPTNERFKDPRTNRIMRVWEDAAGTRHYVPEPPDT